MTTKIEEVARAIYEKSPLYGAKANIGEAMRPLTWDEAARYGHEDYFEMARAAIEAMREPDDAMRKAVNDLYRDHARGRLEKPDADEIWPVMIDAALNEGKE